jgi:small subunit ribosomal protein S2
MSLPEVIKELLENGVHFGHLSKHWNPKMQKFIFGKKKNVYIIDLERTAQKLAEAQEFIKQTAARGGKILFVTTKRQLRDLVKDLAESCDMPYINERWIGGFLTNFSTIRSRINKYLDLINKRDTGKFEKMLKKEVVRLNRQIEKMEKIYSGVTKLESYPGCVLVIDPTKEVSCVREAQKLSIPIIGLIDTDGDPDVIDYPVPGNDDAIKSVKYIVSSLVEAIKEGQKLGESLEKKKKKEAPAEKKQEAAAVKAEESKQPKEES